AALGAPLVVVIDGAAYLWSAFMLGRIRGEPRDTRSTTSSRDLRGAAAAGDSRDSSGARSVTAGAGDSRDSSGANSAGTGDARDSSGVPAERRRTEASGALGSTKRSAQDLRRISETSGALSASLLAQGDLQIGLRAVFKHRYVRPVVLALMVWSIAGGFF